MIKSLKVLKALVLILALAYIVAILSKENSVIPPIDKIFLNLNEEENTDKATEEAKSAGEILLVAVGDIMVHKSQFPSAYNQELDKYDFRKWFRPVEKYLHEADIAIANLETTLSGEDLGYSGFPVFNTPESLAFDLKEIGFSILSTANNHSLDRLEAGVINTIEHLEEAGLAFTGTARSAEERDNIPVIEKNDIRVAFLAYTYDTNGIPIPDDKEYLINMIDEELIREDIERVQEDGAEVIVVSLHWGNEYSREPTQEQRKLAEKIILWGGDLILGSHPHVLQPVEFITVGEGDTKREGVVIYSLGNFIADQIILHTDSGLILRARYARDEEGNVGLAEINCVPTWIHSYNYVGPREFRVLAVEEAISNYEQGKDPLLRNYHHQRLQQTWKETRALIWLETYKK